MYFNNHTLGHITDHIVTGLLFLFFCLFVFFNYSSYISNIVFCVPQEKKTRQDPVFRFIVAIS